MQVHSCDIKSHINRGDYFPITIHDTETGEEVEISSVRKTFVGGQMRGLSLGVRVSAAGQESVPDALAA